MKEHYVTYDQAVKLKELGFDEPCYNFWSLEPDGNPLIIISTLGDVCNSDLKGRDVTAPFLWQAQAWLREIKGIHISLNPYSISPDRYDGDNYFWSFELFHVPTGGWLKVNGGGFDTYESALSAGIDKALELLTNKS